MSENVILTNSIFNDLIEAATFASSADNMQPWEFRKKDQTIEVFMAESRKLPTDVDNMFSWISIGAAIQNIVEKASSIGLKAIIESSFEEAMHETVATIKFSAVTGENNLGKWIPERTTNRNPFINKSLGEKDISDLTECIANIKAGLYWTTDQSDFNKVSAMDANLSYIRMEYRLFHDELFNILRFSQKEMERTGYGLSFESLGIPPAAMFFAKMLKNWTINKAISKLGIGKLVAKDLASKLRKCGAICLITSKHHDPAGYIEAGRAMERIWLLAGSKGLSVHPYGVLPQYLTKSEMEPHTFLPRYLDQINKQRATFYSIFPRARNQYPAIILRIGKASAQNTRSNIRLSPQQVMREM